MLPKLKDYISDDLVFLKIDKKTDREVLEYLANELTKKGFVKNSFCEALLEREGYAPTGLRTDIIGAAIPHSEPQHVIKPCVAIATLLNPVPFIEMGTSNSMVEVKIVFCLALDKGENHMEVLQNVISLITEDKTISEIVNMDSKHELILKLLSFEV